MKFRLKIAFDNEASDSPTGQAADRALQEKMTTEQVAVAQKLAAGLSQRIKFSQSQ